MYLLGQAASAAGAVMAEVRSGLDAVSLMRGKLGGMICAIYLVRLVPFQVII